MEDASQNQLADRGYTCCMELPDEEFIDGVLRCKGPARAIDQARASRRKGVAHRSQEAASLAQSRPKLDAGGPAGGLEAAGS